MNLTDTTQVLRIVLGEAMTTTNCDITASFADFNVNNFLLGLNPTRSNGTTPVVVVAAPAVDTQRQVKEIRLFNNDTVTHNVTLELFDGSNTWIIGSSATPTPVPVGGSFVYTPEAGVCCTSGGGGTSLTILDDTGDTITSTGTLQFNAVKVSGSTPSGIVNMATIVGAAGVGTTAGVNLLLVGGLGGSGGASSYGGNTTIVGGNGGTASSYTYGGDVIGLGGVGGDGPNSYGGDFNFQAGAGGNGTVNASGGGFQLFGGNGGNSAPNAYGGQLLLRGGRSYGVSGPGGRIAMYGGIGGGTGQGGEIDLTPGAGSPPGKIIVNGDTSLIVADYSWVAGALLDNQTIFTATRAMVVTAVIGRPDAANGSAATLTIVKAASGTPPAGGTALTSTSMDLDGTPDTNQTLTLSGTLADITLAPGDSLCMTTTGALTLSAGCITIWGTPQ